MSCSGITRKGLPCKRGVNCAAHRGQGLQLINVVPHVPRVHEGEGLTDIAKAAKQLAIQLVKEHGVTTAIQIWNHLFITSSGVDPVAFANLQAAQGEGVSLGTAFIHRLKQRR